MGKPFSIEITGLDELVRALDKAPKKANKIAKQGLYEGAGAMADALTKEINSIATEPFKYAKKGKKRMPSPEEKAILEKARHGVKRFKDIAIEVSTSVGFQQSGYAPITWNHARSGKRIKYKTTSGKSVKPIAVIANSINHGTSFMTKQPFARKAFEQNEGAATAAIEKGIESRLDELDLE